MMMSASFVSASVGDVCLVDDAFVRKMSRKSKFVDYRCIWSSIVAGSGVGGARGDFFRCLRLFPARYPFRGGSL